MGTPGSATVVMAGNTVSKPGLRLGASGPTLTWTSVNGATYRIAYKNSLAEVDWTFTPTTISAAGATSSWTDTDKVPQRFYLIVRVQ